MGAPFKPGFGLSGDEFSTLSFRAKKKPSPSSLIPSEEDHSLANDLHSRGTCFSYLHFKHFTCAKQTRQTLLKHGRATHGRVFRRKCASALCPNAPHWASRPASKKKRPFSNLQNVPRFKRSSRNPNSWGTNWAASSLVSSAEGPRRMLSRRPVENSCQAPSSSQFLLSS